jgi:hypothetical protein
LARLKERARVPRVQHHDTVTVRDTAMTRRNHP